MRAIVYSRFGPPDVLELREVDQPQVAEGDVLVRVRAASVNPADWYVMAGVPYVARPQMGLRKPKTSSVGLDLAGVVAAVGGGVTRFTPGDEVFGAGTGTLAEYAAVPEAGLVGKPANLSFEQAAAVPVAALTALQGLRDKGRIQPGHKVLINGASGGVGTFAVQIAKSFGTDVTGVCSTRNLAMVRSLGADQVVDYTTTDALGDGRRYDRILDTVGNRSVRDLRAALVADGKAAVTGFTSVRGLLGVSLRGGKDVTQVQAHATARDLELLAELIEAGKVRPRIDRRYRFADLPAAIAYLEEGHAKAKVVVAIP
jgi:NADPH:quinone reductase-like Zn-dependent oxidoreductase